jgi:hypothetical protein
MQMGTHEPVVSAVQRVHGSFNVPVDGPEFATLAAALHIQLQEALLLLNDDGSTVISDQALHVWDDRLGTLMKRRVSGLWTYADGGLGSGAVADRGTLKKSIRVEAAAMSMPAKATLLM